MARYHPNAADVCRGIIASALKKYLGRFTFLIFAKKTVRWAAALQREEGIKQSV